MLNFKLKIEENIYRRIEGCAAVINHSIVHRSHSGDTFLAGTYSK